MTPRGGVVLRRAVASLILFGTAIACAPSEPRGLHVSAEFEATQALYEGSEVRILGVSVGSVTKVTPQGDTVLVDMVVTADQPVPADVRAAVTPVSLLGERVVSLEPAYTGGATFEDGGTIPLERTAVPAEIDEVLRSFQAFAEALDERTLARLIDVSAETLDGQGAGLNQLIDQGADTVEVLDAASGDLNAMVTEVGRLNATLATRDEKLGRTLRRLSVVLNTFAEEKDDIIGSIVELRRLTAELRPLVDEHTDPLIRDLEVLTTSLSTLNRNIDRFPDLYAASHRLLKDLPQLAANYEDGGAKLNNKGEELVAAVELRTVQRLAGMCIRLDVPECSDADFWEQHLGDVTCLSTHSCPDPGTSLGDALAHALGELPTEAKVALERDLRRRRVQTPRRDGRDDGTTPSEQPAQESLTVPTPTPTETTPLLPPVDPRLDDVLGG